MHRHRHAIRSRRKFRCFIAQFKLSDNDDELQLVRKLLYVRKQKTPQSGVYHNFSALFTDQKSLYSIGNCQFKYSCANFPNTELT